MLIYCLKTQVVSCDGYEGFYEDKDLFRFSDILKDSNFFEIKGLFDFSDILKDSNVLKKKLLGEGKMDSKEK